MNVETEISSIREDIKEIKRLLEVAKRPKVEAVLSIELRRYETKLSEMMNSYYEKYTEKSKNQANQNTNVEAAIKAKADKKNEVPKMDDDSGDPSKGLMNMMKKMYDEGDDDMKRTIAKAWTESQNKGPGAGLGAGGMGAMDL